jgi:hypothetical protein
MITLARWTTRTFNHELPLELYPAVLERLRGTPARAAELLQTVSEPLRCWRMEPSWSAHQHIGHLDDLHDLDMRRLQDYASASPVLSAADMSNRKTDEADHNTVATRALLERLREHRDELVRQLEQFDETQVARAARHPRLQRTMRVIDWMYFVAEHDDHHLARAREVLGLARGAR